METVGRIMQVLARPAEQGRLLQVLVDEATRLADASAALLVPEPDDTSILRFQLGSAALADYEGELLPAEGSFAGMAFLDGERQVTADLSSDRRAFRTTRHGVYLGPACALPLAQGARRFGTLLVAREPFASPFEPEELDLLAAACDVFSAALANAARFHHVRGDRNPIDSWRRLQHLSGWQCAYEASCRAGRQVVLRWNVRTGVFEWGPTLEDVVGISPERFGSTLPDWLPHVAPPDRERVQAMLERGMHEWEPLELQFDSVVAGGVRRRLRLRILSPQPDSAIRVGILDDAGQPVRRAPEPEGDAVANLVRALRHEINNPLAAVLGQLQLLEHDAKVAECQSLQDAVQIMKKESKRIDLLVRRLAMLEHGSRGPFISVHGGLEFPPESR